ncbi:circularly permuted type 2 ATP-grasp protein [Pseudonocardia bannensis]|uniref:Circularly permuted type 2 ATP-grasp protein n=1 Tax=Pseudonocardia bannensis TaxID=630973 RepID=A0A848DFD8_9PSEU|nr:circularly permuted type 2 ATP-grasp protein [Pseudonocardia bannensis]NMH91263.1 circularly permuted type 2 ATP-grasp protein [Pseudonocardia bannensis]
MTTVSRAADRRSASGRTGPAGQNGSALFDGYLEPDRPHPDAFDEMFATDGTVRAPYRALHGAIAPTAAADLSARSEALDRAFVDQGITFSLSGKERPFPLDIVPRVISAGEWSRLQHGIVQRVQALEAFLADVYGDAQIVRDGVLPRRLITSCEHFHREAANLNPPNGVRIHVAGIDLVRDEKGTFRVLEDNLRSPSGVSYVMENRRTMARVFPDLFARQRVRQVGDYSTHLLRALRAAAAPNVADPLVVVLTPGVYNSAYFEHSLLARQMGVELVEGRDLFCRDNSVYMRTTEGEQQVDVIYRRIDDEFLDPLQFNPDSVLGVAGVLNAARAGNVVIANAVGNGVGDDKLVYTYVPQMISYYLNEKPLLENVETYRCWLDDERDHVLAHLDELVIKPVEGSGGYGIVFGPDATAKQLTAARKAIREDPHGWIAQPVVQLSTVPTKVGDRLVPRHVDLRPFAVNDGDDVFVLPGGLTRVALPKGSLVVNSSQGGGSKDTWVLAAGRVPEADRELGRRGLASIAPSSPAAEHGPELTIGQQQQQQQQAGDR